MSKLFALTPFVGLILLSGQPAYAAQGPTATSSAAVQATPTPDFVLPDQSDIANDLSEDEAAEDVRPDTVRTLPYSSTYAVSSGLVTSALLPVSGQICLHLTASPPGYGSVLHVQGPNGGAVNFPQDGKAYGYCWKGLSAGVGYTFKLLRISGPMAAGTFSATAK